MERAASSDGRGPTSSRACGIRTGWKAGVVVRTGAADWQPVPDTWTVRTQLQSDGQAEEPDADVPRPQFGSFASTGDTQQQNHSVVPQVRPSHSQLANTGGAADDTSSARRVTTQTVRQDLTALLWADSAPGSNGPGGSPPQARRGWGRRARLPGPSGAPWERRGLETENGIRRSCQDTRRCSDRQYGDRRGTARPGLRLPGAPAPLPQRAPRLSLSISTRRGTVPAPPTTPSAAAARARTMGWSSLNACSKLRRACRSPISPTGGRPAHARIRRDAQALLSGGVPPADRAPGSPSRHVAVGAGEALDERIHVDAASTCGRPTAGSHLSQTKR